MTKSQKARKIIEILKLHYPPHCALKFDTPFQLLVAVRLSAQCTDARVNQITPSLFARFKTPFDFANADISEIEQLIFSCGFYHTKARDLKNLSIMLLEKFDGELPNTLDELLTLPGVGRKTANLVMGDVFGAPAIVCDTHVIRITNRLGLGDTKDPKKLEMELKAIIPDNESNDFCHRIILFGRDICKSQNPECQRCFLREFCKAPKV